MILRFYDEDGKYHQPSLMRTHSVCCRLQKAKGDIGIVIKYIGERFFNRSLALSDNGRARVKELKRLYTPENIEKEYKIDFASNRVHRRDLLNDDDYELYIYAMKIVSEYCDVNSDMSDQERFCLYFFLGGLYSHLRQFFRFVLEFGAEPGSFALEYYTKALALARQLKEIDLNSITSIFESKIVKHQAISVSHGFDSMESFLASKTYIDRKIYQNFSHHSLDGLSDKKIHSNSNLSLCGLNDLPQLFKSVGCTKFSKLVLKLNALDSLAHKRFKILFVDEMPEKNVEGSYNQRNTVRVLAHSCQHKEIRCTLLHELTHKAMDQVFENACCPYRKNNEMSKQAYRSSMRQVLLNLNEFAGVIGDIDRDNLSFNELIHFCFSDEIVFDRVKEKNDIHMLSLFKCLRSVFLDYLVSNLDAEFITNSLQYFIEVESDSAYVHCIQPLLDYINLYVIHEIEKYIKEHPWSGRLFS